MKCLQSTGRALHLEISVFLFTFSFVFVECIQFTFFPWGCFVLVCIFFPFYFVVFGKRPTFSSQSVLVPGARVIVSPSKCPPILPSHTQVRQQTQLPSRHSCHGSVTRSPCSGATRRRFDASSLTLDPGMGSCGGRHPRRPQCSLPGESLRKGHPEVAC